MWGSTFMVQGTNASSWSLVDTHTGITSGATQIVNLTVEVGDLMVVVVSTRGSATPAISGWTTELLDTGGNILSSTSEQTSFAMIWKIATTTGPQEGTVTGLGSNSSSIAAAAFRKAGTISVTNSAKATPTLDVSSLGLSSGDTYDAPAGSLAVAGVAFADNDQTSGGSNVDYSTSGTLNDAKVSTKTSFGSDSGVLLVAKFVNSSIGSGETITATTDAATGMQFGVIIFEAA